MSLPIIDISAFLSSGSARLKGDVAVQLDDACRRYGAFYLKGHGIDTGAVVSAMKEFFSLDAAVKRSIAIAPGGFTRGYIGMGEESGSTALEVKEAFSYGYPWAPGRAAENPMQGANVWPPSAAFNSEWQHKMEEFYSDMVRISKALVRAFSSGYGYDEEYLSGFCERGDTISVMRLFHYFPYHKADEAYPDQHDRIGSSAHTDWGFLTLIVQEPGVTGLQLFQEDRWMDVPPVEGTLLVNCGDYFSLLTGGVYKSPLHRVISEGKERSSAVLFYYPDYEARIPVLARQNYSLFENQAELHPADGNIDPADTPFGEYIHNKWEQVQRAASHPQK